MKYLISILLIQIAIQSVNSQVVINEFSCANFNGHNFASGWNEEYCDYLELYNGSSETISLDGYWLSDDINEPMKWEFPDGVALDANKRLVVLFTGRGHYEPDFLGYLNTNFMVTQTEGEDVVFSDPGGNVLEYYNFEIYQVLRDNHVWGRFPDGDSQWKIADTMSPGDENEGATYSGYASTPIFNMGAGYYSEEISVEILSANDDETIYYTLDGSAPDDTGTPYTTPIVLSETTVVRAVVYSSDQTKLPGFIETNTYFFGGDFHTIPIVAIAGNEFGDGSWAGDYNRTDIEFFTPDGVFIVEAHGRSNEHGNDSNAYPQHGFDYITSDERGFDDEVELPLMHLSDRQSYERLIFKCAGNDNYPFSDDGSHVLDAFIHELSVLGNLELDERKAEACVVYINGEYWGVYYMHEKVDDTDYFKHYYNQPRGYVDMLKTWGGTWEEYGSGDDWYDLVDFAVMNDLNIASNFEYVVTQIDPASIADYFILNSFIINSSWLNWDTEWWRGRHPDGEAKRWRYALWDMDANFGNYYNFSGIPDTSPYAPPCQPETMGDLGNAGHVPLFNAMMENDQFYCYYVSRYYELANNLLGCENLTTALDSMVAVIEPEMNRQIERWGGDYNQWTSNVEQLRNFILERCDSVIMAGLLECYDEIAPSSITMIVEGAGEVDVNYFTVDEGNSPYTQSYCNGVLATITVDSSPDCGFFLGWQVVSGDVELADSLATEITLLLEGDITIMAIFGEQQQNPTAFVDVEPVGSGVILLNGDLYSDFPFNSEVGVGATNEFVAIPNPFFVFDHWETTNTSEITDSESESIEVHLCEDGTLTAVFEYDIGIRNNDAATIIVYPNPATGSFTILGNILSRTLWIYDNMGQVVMEKVNCNINEFDVSHLSSGLYTVCVDEERLLLAVVN